MVAVSDVVSFFGKFNDYYYFTLIQNIKASEMLVLSGTCQERRERREEVKDNHTKEDPAVCKHCGASNIFQNV